MMATTTMIVSNLHHVTSARPQRSCEYNDNGLFLLQMSLYVHRDHKDC